MKFFNPKSQFVVSIILISIFNLFCSGILIPQSADISLNEIYLHNPVSVVAELGKEISISELGDYSYNSYSVMPHVAYCNQDSTRIFYLIQHPGAELYSFSEFAVTQFSNGIGEELICLKVDEFESGNGIKLGMVKSELIDILGSDFVVIKNIGRIITIQYSISELETSEFLKHYNMPIYTGTYSFRDSILTKFSFGFEYP